MVVIRMVSAPYFRCQLPTVNGPSHGLAFKTLPGKGASLLPPLEGKSSRAL